MARCWLCRPRLMWINKENSPIESMPEFAMKIEQ